MKIVECANCGFYVRPDEKSCPDCGLIAPSVFLQPIELKIENRLITKTAGIFAAAIAMGFVLYRLNGDSVDFSDWFRLAAIGLFFAVAASVLAVIINARKSASTEQKKRFAGAENGACLQSMQDICLMRNHDLNEKQRESGGAARRGIRLSDGEIKTEQRRTAAKISRLIVRYDFFVNRIFFARLQNELLPLAVSRNEPDDAAFFVELDEIAQEIEKFGAGIKRDFSDKNFGIFMTEKQNFLAAIEKTKASCAALVERRKNSARIDAVFAAPISEDFAGQLATLDARRAVKEISQTFNKLEREFKSLKI